MTDLFSGGEDKAPAIDPNKDYLPELVGEGKKFKTPQDLARGKYEADMFIETLKRQQDELRTDYLKLKEDSMARAKLEELLDQFSKKQQPASSEHTQANVDNQKPLLDTTEIETMIESKMEARELSRRQEQNVNTVMSRLKERYGNNYQNVLNEQAEALELTKEDINALARKSPAAFFRTIGLDEPERKENFQSPPRSTQRSDSFHQKGNTKRTWSYYQELKKSNPKVYLDPKTTNQMHKDYLELGKEFEDGDFGA